MKTLGIIGGLGPETTSKVYLSVINQARKIQKDTYPSVVIYNLPFPFIIENEAIIQGVNAEKMIPYLIDGAKILEKAGASFGILPCNTLHKYIEEIRSSIKIPFLSILEEVSLKLQKLKIKKVGILATQTTIQSKIYSDALEKVGMEVLYPVPSEQKSINKIIVQLLNNKKDKSQTVKINAICKSIQKRGAETILLACTDLQIAMSKINKNIKILDTTQVLIDASVRQLTRKN